MTSIESFTDDDDDDETKNDDLTNERISSVLGFISTTFNELLKKVFSSKNAD